MPRHEIVGWVCLVVVCAWTGAGAGGAGPADIEALIKTGKLDEAISAGRAAVANRPDDPDLRGALAHALAAKGRRVDRVLDVTVGSAQIDKGSIPIRPSGKDQPQRLEVSYDSALFEESLGQIREAIRLAPKREDLRLTECYLLTDAGDIERASAAIRRAITDLPASPSLPHDLASYGAERAARGDLQGAVILTGIVAKSFPGDAEVQADDGLLLMRAGKKAEALAAVDRAASAAPKSLDIQRRRASVAVLLHDSARARSAYQAAFAIEHQDEDRLGAAAAAIGADAKVARAELEELATPAASASPALVAFAGDFLRALAAAPASRTSLDVARGFSTAGQDLLAVPLLDRALRAKPGQPEATELLAGIYARFDCPVLATGLRRAPPAPAAKKAGTSVPPAPHKP